VKRLVAPQQAVKEKENIGRYQEISEKLGRTLAKAKITNIPATGKSIEDIQRRIARDWGSVHKTDFHFGDTPVCAFLWDTGSGVYIPNAIIYVQKIGVWYLVYMGGSKDGNWFMNFEKIDESTLGIYEAKRYSSKGMDPFRLMKKVQVIY
jgi:hypothetical protein